MDETSKIEAEKLEQVEQSRPTLNFFNKWSLRLMASTNSAILGELSVRTFAGSRDIPKDVVKAAGLLGYAAQNAETSKDKN